MTKEEEKYTTLDTEQCKWWVNTLFNMAKEDACNSHNFDDAREIQSAQDKIITALEQQPSDDCVSRQAVRDAIMKCETMNEDSVDGFIESTTELEAEIACLPPVTPTQCIAEVKFSKDDLREICNERIEIACEHGICKNCKNCDSYEESPYFCKKQKTWITRDNFGCTEFRKRGNEDDSN